MIDKHVATLLRDNGFVLVRQYRHMIFRHSSGAQLTVAASPRNSHVQLLKVRSDVRRITQAVVGKQ